MKNKALRIFASFLSAAFLFPLPVCAGGARTETPPAKPAVTDISDVPAADTADNGSVFPQVPDMDDQECYIFGAVNEERVKGGIPALQPDENLAKLADKRAAECAQLFSHTRPDKQAWYTIGQDAGQDIVYGENLSEWYSFAEVTGKWMASKEHRTNIMDGNGNFEIAGVGSYTNPKTGVVYYVELFGYRY